LRGPGSATAADLEGFTAWRQILQGPGEKDPAGARYGGLVQKLLASADISGIAIMLSG